jgi:Domain of unknown function (DUF4386)
MTRRMSARIAGSTFLIYIAAAFPAMILTNRATAGTDISAKLASVAQHVTEMRITILLGFISVLCALVLAVTLYAITRDEDQELAMLGMVCRLGEGVISTIPLPTLGLLWLATTNEALISGAGVASLAGLLLRLNQWGTLTAASLFAVGSTLFAYLLLRGRMVPVPLAWLGVLGSLLVVIEVPLELAGFLSGPLTQLVWIPVAIFELTLGPWLIIKGVAPARTQWE